MELPINPLYNVFNEYRMTKIINPYRFGEAPLDLKDGLVSAWEFEETGANVAYDAVGSNNGTNNGATVQQPSVARGYYFNGTSDTISFGNIGNVKSISFWINLWSTTESIFEESSGVGVSVSGGTLSYGSWDNAYVDTVDTDTISTGWKHVVLTSTTNVSLSAFTFGVITASYLDGTVDQIALWTDEVSVSDIETLYGGGHGLKYDYWDTGLKTNLVSVWELDETTGTTVTDSHGSNNGTNSGATVNLQGIVSNLEKCYSFDGSNDNIEVPDSDDFSFGDGSDDNPFSLSVWIKFNANKSCWVFNKRSNTGDEEWQLIHSATDNQFKIFLFSEGVGSIYIGGKWDFTYTTDWTHLAITYDASKAATGFKGYINGTEATLITNSSGTYVAMNNYGAALKLGCRWDNNGVNNLNGKLEQPAIWNGRVLSASEVSEIYNSGKGLNFTKWSSSLKTDLVSLWKFDETSSATVCYDSHGNNDGTINGATVNQTGKVGKCYDYSGSDYVDMGNVLDYDGSSAFSISLWVNPDTGTSMTFAGKLLNTAPNSGWSVFMRSDRYVEFYLVDTFGSDYIVQRTSSQLTLGVWTHIVFTYDGSKTAAGIKCYIDGSEETLSVQADALTGSTSTTASFSIGSRDNVALFTDGGIDQVFIWDKELSSSNAAWLYNDDNGRAYSEL